MRSAALFGAMFLLSTPALAQQVAPHAAVVPQDITVGDIFHAAVRVELPPGVDLAVADSLILPDDIERAGRREIRYDSAAAAGGARRATVLFPLAAWRPGSYELPAVRLHFVSDGAETSVDVALPSFSVRSVLPADTAEVAPRAAKDVLGANRLWWPILLALLLAAIIAALLYWWWRRRQQAEAVPSVVMQPMIPARTVALERLEALRRAGLLERGEVKLYYERLTEALRHYVASLDPAWSVDLTTSELSGRVRAVSFTDALELTRILGAADLVKFARARPPNELSFRELDAARAWIERAEPVQTTGSADERRVA